MTQSSVENIRIINGSLVEGHRLSTRRKQTAGQNIPASLGQLQVEGRYTVQESHLLIGSLLIVLLLTEKNWNS